MDFAHQYGVSVEGEIGHVGGVEDDISVSEKDANYTSVKRRNSLLRRNWN